MWGLTPNYRIYKRIIINSSSLYLQTSPFRFSDQCKTHQKIYISELVHFGNRNICISLFTIVIVQESIISIFILLELQYNFVWIKIYNVGIYHFILKSDRYLQHCVGYFVGLIRIYDFEVFLADMNKPQIFS